MNDTHPSPDAAPVPVTETMSRARLPDPASLHLRARRLLILVSIAYVALIATHDGEFWPFSIYPMFSRGGHPWERVLVADAPYGAEAYTVLHAQPLYRLPDNVVSLDSVGLAQNDLTGFIERTADWDDARRAALQHFVQSASNGTNRWLIYKVEGTLTDSATVLLTVTPLVLVTPDTVALRSDPVQY